MAGIRAPKQWCLTKHETINSFESWRQNLQYTLSLDHNFAAFLVDGFTWQKKTNAAPLRGFENDDEGVPEATRRTAAQKCTHLDLMLGQIANYCPVISRNTIVKHSTSVKSIWQAIRLHFGFQSTGGHFLDFNNIHLEPGERHEDLYQRLASFVEDNLLRTDGGIRHHGEIPDTDEELSPSLENFIVLQWLRLINRDLPGLVKQRYGTELRSQTLASLKPEISQALDSLLDEVHSAADSKVLRAALKGHSNSGTKPSGSFNRPKTLNKLSTKSCILCKQAGRPHQHFLSMCDYLPEDDRKYMRSKVRQSVEVTSNVIDDEDDLSDDSTCPEDSGSHKLRVVASTRRVHTKQSPYFKAFYGHHPLNVTLDTGAEISMVKASTATYIGVPIKKSTQSALQADGVTPLNIIGEIHLTLTRDNVDLNLEALVVNDLDVDILAGIPFMSSNDISVRPAKNKITINGCDDIFYGNQPSNSKSTTNRVRRAQSFILRSASKSCTVWPGCFVELNTPSDIDPDATLAVEPHVGLNRSSQWPRPHIIESVARKVRIVNDTSEPQTIRKHEHLCQAHLTCKLTKDNTSSVISPDCLTQAPPKRHTTTYNNLVSVDPDKILDENTRKKFNSVLEQYNEVFSDDIAGYNGEVGPFKATVNMGPVLPPQRKGRLPQYSRDKLVELQDKFDELETKGVFCRPENIGVNVEYLNPSFLIKKPSGGYRLVTAFADVGRYSKPQPSLMPDVDSTLRTIGQWKYIITSDLVNAFYQIPLSKDSMKYCGVVTPFKGVRVYTRCAMGMPGSETALEELMCRVLGDCLQDGIVAKLADDLYCGANTPEELLRNWTRVLQALKNSGLCLSPSKTIICPRSTTVLGWIWSQGTLSASQHRIAVLSSCDPPDSVKGLRSYIGAYKMLSRVLPHCSQVIDPMESAISGMNSSDKVKWTENLRTAFSRSQEHLDSHKSVVIPKTTDQLWIVTDGSVSKSGIGATMYVSRDGKLKLAGFFSAKLRKHQINWLPCEVEALSISAAVKHFSPYIIQSSKVAQILTDSKPCVQAFEKLCRGEFSASPRVTSFLSIVSRYQVGIHHLAGSANIPSDFASRNAPSCDAPNCQICNFISRTEDCVVREINVQEILNDGIKLPYTTRSAWVSIQSECPDLRRTHAHLKQGTRPSKKLTNIKDVKRYLSVATIAKDGLLVVRRCDPLSPPSELIIVPRSVIDGLVTALHLKLDHPTKHQMQQVLKRNFYALDILKTIDRVCESCHVCASLQKVPKSLIKQSTEDPPETVGISFAADVLKRSRQLILLVRETATSFTTTCIIPDEKCATLRDSLAKLMVELHPIDGPCAVVRVDPAPGFTALKDDSILKRLNIAIEVGRIKNINKNPVAEKAIAELENEILRQEPGGAPITPLILAVATARLNSRIRSHGLSARELWTHRNQYNHEQLPISDREIIVHQHQQRQTNHPYSESSKSNHPSRPSPDIKVGDLVYLYCDGSKHESRNRYIVTSINGEWCFIKKFSGKQLRASSYKVKLSECFLVSNTITDNVKLSEFPCDKDDNDNDIEDINTIGDNNTTYVPTTPVVPPLLYHPPGEYNDMANEDAFTNSDEVTVDNLPAFHGFTEVDNQNKEEKPRSSGRERRPPKHLQDYVCY